MRGKDLMHTFEVMGNERRSFLPCGALKIKQSGVMYFLCIILCCAYIGAVFLSGGSVQQFGKLVNGLLRFERRTLAVQMGKDTSMCIYEVAADNHPSACAFRCGDITPVCQEFEEIDKICLLARPVDFAIGVTSGEERKEIIGMGV